MKKKKYLNINNKRIIIQKTINIIIKIKKNNNKITKNIKIKNNFINRLKI